MTNYVDLITDASAFIRSYGAETFISELKFVDKEAFQLLLLAVQDNTQEELDVIRALQVAHFGDN